MWVEVGVMFGAVVAGKVIGIFIAAYLENQMVKVRFSLRERSDVS